MKRAMSSFLLACCMLCAIVCTGSRCSAAEGGEEWKLATKGLSFKQQGMTFFQALERTAAAGIKYIDVTPSQEIGGGLPGTMDYTMDAATREKVLEKCRQTGVSMPIYGMAKISSEADCRQLFEFAKAMGVQIIVMEPKAEHMAMLEKYCNEYGIDLAIHNHPQPSHYWNTETVLAAVKGRGKRIGACADTGHWMRSGLDPLACLKQMEGRIIMLHFKDVVPDAPGTAPAQPAKGKKAGKGKGARKAAAKKMHDVEWGTGDCKAAALLAELKRQGFKGYFAMEYEHPESFLENLPRNAAFFNRCKAMSEDELRSMK